MTIAAGADDIDCAFAQQNRFHVAAHGSDRAANFADGFALVAQAEKECGNLLFLRFAAEDDVEGGLRFFNGQVVAMFDLFDGVIKTHSFSSPSLRRRSRLCCAWRGSAKDRGQCPAKRECLLRSL